MTDHNTSAERSTAALRPEIAKSWRRSRLYGVDPGQVDPFYSEITTDTRFTHVAVPVLAGMAHLLRGSEAGLALSDPHGRILWRWVDDPGLRRVLDKHSVDTGFDFNEEWVGTNGLGTALETGRPMLVQGDEHFSEPLRIFTCMAAPVRDPITNRVLGALNITCQVENTNRLLHPLLLRLIDEVRHRLLEYGGLRERQLLQGFLSAPRRSGKPVLSMNEDVFIGNHAAQQLQLNQGLLWAHIRDAHAQGRTELLVPGCERYLARFRSVFDGDDLVGAVLVLHERPDGHGPSASPPSPTWDELVKQVRQRAHRSGTVVVRGERGVGKSTLITAALAGPAADGIEVLDVALHSLEGTRNWLRRLKALLNSTGIVLLTHLEAAGEQLSRAICAVLDQRRDGVPVLAATATAGPERMCAADAAILERLGSPVEIPALRNRISDLHQLLDEFAPSGAPPFSAAARKVLENYSWPGNIRELAQVVRESTASCGRVAVEVADLPRHLRTAADRTLSPLERAEASVIATILDECGGNKTAAASRLRISRTSLYQKMRTYHI